MSSKRIYFYKMPIEQDVAFHFDKVEYPVLHTHEYYEMVLTNNGSVMHEIDGNNYVVYKNQVILLAPESKHKTTNNGCEYDALDIQITVETFERVCGAVGKDIYANVVKNIPFCFDLSDLEVIQIRELIAKAQQYSFTDEKRRLILMHVAFILVSGIVKTLFIEVHTEPGVKNNKVVESFFTLLQNRNNICKSFDELCTEIPYHKSHILRVFKQRNLETPNNILMNYKFNLATNFLITTDMKVIDICNEIGYSSVAYFNKVFKRKFGCTPKEYRRNRGKL